MGKKKHARGLLLHKVWCFSEKHTVLTKAPCVNWSDFVYQVLELRCVVLLEELGSSGQKSHHWQSQETAWKSLARSTEQVVIKNWGGSFWEWHLHVHTCDNCLPAQSITGSALHFPNLVWVPLTSKSEEGDLGTCSLCPASGMQRRPQEECQVDQKPMHILDRQRPLPCLYSRWRQR